MARQTEITAFMETAQQGPLSEVGSDGMDGSSADVEEAWGLSVEVDQSSAQKLLELLEKAHATYGGLEKFLQVRFQNRDEVQSFCHYLGEICPCGSGHEYAIAGNLPKTSQDQLECSESLRIHPASFAFMDSATVRGPAESDTVMKLAEEILKDGLVTSGEPLLLTQSDQLTNEVVKFSGDAEVDEAGNILHVGAA